MLGSRTIGCVGTAVLMAAVLPARAETLPPGGQIAKALTGNVTPDGIDFMLGQGIEMIPDQFAFPYMEGTVNNACLFGDIDYWIYQGQPSNGVKVTVNEATLVPQQGYFALGLNITVVGTGNDAGQNRVIARAEYSGCGTSCNTDKYAVLRLNPTPVGVSTEVYLTMTTDPVSGDPIIEATTPLERGDISLSTSGFDAAGCSLIDLAVAAAKGFMGDYVKDKIIEAVNDTLLPAIEEGFKSVRYDDSIDLAGKSLDVKIVPSALSIRTDGVSLSMSSIIAAQEPTKCVPVAADAGSALTPGDPPTFGTISPGGFAYDAAAVISDDLVNQALFAAWHGGLLCHSLSDLEGTPITTDLLAVAGLSGPLKRLGVEAGTPVLIVVKGYEQPTGSFGGDHTVNLSMKRFEVNVFTQVADRTARIVALDLDIDTGIDLAIDSNNQMNIQLALEADDIAGTIAYGEPLGDSAEGLLQLLPLILDQVAPELAGALPTIDLGNLAGVSMVDPEIVVETGNGGPPNDTLGFYTGLAPAPGGCAASGGCGVGGGTAGCDVRGRRAGSPANAAAMLFLLLAPLATVASRRFFRGA